MAKYAEARFLKMLDHICLMKLPFNSLIRPQIIEIKNEKDKQDFWLEIPIFLIQMLIEVEMYIHEAVYVYRDMKVALEQIKRRPGMEKQIKRFDLYRELKQGISSDRKIFEEMFKRSPEIKNESFKKYYDRMRKWKYDHKEILNYDGNLIIHENKLPLQVSCNLGDDFGKLLKKLVVVGRESAIKLNCLNVDRKNGIYKDKKLFEYHYLTQIVVRIIDRTKWGTQIYNDYIAGLREIGFMTALGNLEKAKDLSTIAKGKRVKAPLRPSPTDRKADLYRALATSRNYSFNSPVYNTYRRNYAQLSAEHSNIISENERKRSSNENIIQKVFLNDFLQKRKGTYRTPKVRVWTDVLSMLESFGYKRTKKNVMNLKKIFHVCRLKRDWKIPEELHLKIFFDILEYRGFFEKLYACLDKRAIIKELNGIRWHKVPVPERKNVSLEEWLDSGRIYSPFWKK